MKTSRNDYLRRTQVNGFGLFEAICSLALATGLAASSWAIFAPASSATTVAQETARLDHLRQSVASAYISAVDFQSLTRTEAGRQGYLTDGSRSQDSTAWGDLELAAATTHGSPADSWALTLEGIPEDACAQLISGQRGGRWTTVSVDGRPIADGDAASCFTGDTHQMRFEQWGGTRAGAARLAPLCTTPERAPGGLAECGAPPRV